MTSYIGSSAGAVFQARAGKVRRSGILASTLFVGLLCHCFPIPVLADESAVEVKTSELLELLDARRSVARGYEWSFIHERFEFDIVGSGNSLQESAELSRKRAAMGVRSDVRMVQDQNSSGHVLYDAERQWFRISAASTQPWLQGASSHISTREAIAFDGKDFWEVQQTKPGTELPLEKFTKDTDVTIDTLPIGSIASIAPPGNRVEALYALSGFIFRPGYLALPFGMPLGTSVDAAAFLRELQERNVPVRIRRLDDKRVAVAFDVPDQRGHPEDDGELTMILRMDQLGAVERVTLALSPGYRFVQAEFALVNVEISPGIWFPSEITWIDPANRSAMRITNSDFKVRDSIPVEDCQLQFQPGTRINDHRNQMSFVASTGPRDDALAVREFAATFLGDFDGLNQHLDSEKGKSKPVRAWVVAGSVLILIVFLALWYWQRRKTAPALLLLITIFSGFDTGDVAADDLRATDQSFSNPLKWSEQRGWVLVGQGIRGRELCVAQCGFLTTLLTLTAFDCQCDALQLSRYLEPRMEGISLDRIANVLRAFRLDVEARGAVSWMDLELSLRQGTMAIVVKPSIDQVVAHYVCVVRNRDGRLLLLDPPLGAKVLDSFEGSHVAEQKALCVLFVSQDPNFNEGKDELALSVPVSISVVPDAVDWTKSVNVEFEIKNHGHRPVWVNGMAPSCGCIVAANLPTLVLNGETARVQLSVKPQSWGAGFRRKSVGISIGSGPNLSVLLEGEFIKLTAGSPVPGSGIRNISLPIAWNSHVYQSQIKISPGSGLPPLLHAEVQTGASWCEAAYDGDMNEIVVNVQLEQTMLQRVRSGETLSGRIQLTGAVLAGTWDIRVNQDLSLVHVEPRVAKLTDGAYRFVAKVGTPDDSNWTPRLVASSTSSSVLTQTSERDASGNWAIVGKVAPSIHRATAMAIEFESKGFLPFRIPIVLAP